MELVAWILFEENSIVFLFLSGANSERIRNIRGVEPLPAGNLLRTTLYCAHIAFLWSSKFYLETDWFKMLSLETSGRNLISFCQKFLCVGRREESCKVWRLIYCTQGPPFNEWKSKSLKPFRPFLDRVWSCQHCQYNLFTLFKCLWKLLSSLIYKWLNRQYSRALSTNKKPLFQAPCMTTSAF